MQSFNARLEQFVKRKDISGEDFAELRAIVVMTGRSLERRLQAGVGLGDDVRELLEDALYAQVRCHLRFWCELWFL